VALRVLYAPRNIAGQPTEYATAVRALGLHVEVWNYGPVAFRFPVDRVVDLARWAGDPTYRWDVFDEAVRRFDVFHFQFANSLLIPGSHTVPYLWDLPLLKSLGKRVYMHFRGSDIRLRSHHLATEPESYFRYADVRCNEDLILGRLAICRRFCDGLFVSTPGLLDYVPEAQWIPHVLDPDAWARPPRPERAVPVVCHIPSARGTKGSDHVDSVLGALDAEGICRYRSPRGLSREELRTALQDADLVVDSLGIGDHGLISVEAMAAGAIALAHIHPRNRDRNPGVPVVEVTRDTLAEVIRDLAGDTARRSALRDEGLAWVRRRHNRADLGRVLVERYAQPPSEPARSYPDWPRSETRKRVTVLEAQVDLLQAKLALTPEANNRILRRTEPWQTRFRRRAERSPLARRVYQKLPRSLQRAVAAAGSSRSASPQQLG
jgi:glycosyltransferase involved in cell wall biosynthesis